LADKEADKEAKPNRCWQLFVRLLAAAFAFCVSIVAGWVWVLAVNEIIGTRDLLREGCEPYFDSDGLRDSIRGDEEKFRTAWFCEIRGRAGATRTLRVKKFLHLVQDNTRT
jgi:hypothetical protein